MSQARGIANHGIANHGVSNYGVADHGIADHGISNYGVADRGTADRGTAYCGPGSYGAACHGVDSETGALRAVLVHRPGLELRRMTPRTSGRLLFRSLPWTAGAQREHDAFTDALRGQGVEVLYVTELLQDALEYASARDEAIRAVLARAGAGDDLRDQLGARLSGLATEDLAQVLITGLTAEDLPGGHGLAYQLLGRTGFIVDPLPNLVFTRDSSFWVGDRAAVASLASRRRRREADLLGLIYGHHPRFSGLKRLYGPELEHLHGGDVLALAPSVLAVGVGQRTTPAGAERLARHVLDAGLAHTVLAIPVNQRGGAGYLDNLCTVIDSGAVLMHPAAAYTLTAHVITAGPPDLPPPGEPEAAGQLRDGRTALRVSRPQPFLEAAASALGIERLHVVETGLDPGGRRRQWDDGGNALALAPRLVICHERSTETTARLEATGVAVIRVPGSELASSRGGPRGMACPLQRDPAAAGQPGEADGDPGEELERLSYVLAPLPAAATTGADASLLRDTAASVPEPDGPQLDSLEPDGPAPDSPELGGLEKGGLKLGAAQASMARERTARGARQGAGAPSAGVLAAAAPAA